MDAASGCEEPESAVSKDLPDENMQQKSSSEYVSMEGGPPFDDYFDDYDYYYPPPDDIFYLDEKPVDLPDEPREKAATPRGDRVQDGENVPVGCPQNDFSRESLLAVKQEGVDGRETLKRDEIEETVDQSEGATLVSSIKAEVQDCVDQSEDFFLVNSIKDEILEDISDTFRRKILDCVDDSQETPRVNFNDTVNEYISKGISNKFRREETQVEQSQETSRVNSNDAINECISEGISNKCRKEETQVEQSQEKPRVNSNDAVNEDISKGISNKCRKEETQVEQSQETSRVNSNDAINEYISEGISDKFRKEETQVDQSQERQHINPINEDISEDISDTFRRTDVQVTIEQREETPQENSDSSRTHEGTGTVRVESSEKTQVNIEILSETVKPMEEVTPVGTNVDRPKFTNDQLENIWQLAKKLCEARVAYNQNVCRPTTTTVNRKLPPKKRKQAETLVAQCRRYRRLNTMTNGGVCTIGKGDHSQYDDPPEWDWGQPLPKEICEVIPTRPEPDTPTISLVDDECSPSSSTRFEKASPPRPKLMKPRSPVSKSLKISISVTRFKNSNDMTVVLSDSDEELPDFSMELGIPPRKTEPRLPERFDLTSDGDSCTVIRSAVPQQLAPTTRLTVRKRRRPTENRAPGGPSFPNVNPHEVVVLGSSDESDDPDLEVLQVAKKPAPNESPQKSNSKPKADEKDTWACPICLEPKDKVPNIMSTTCGHIFCGPCLQSTIKINKQCPNCRKKLTLRQIHNLYL